jgi:hypothetical protein
VRAAGDALLIAAPEITADELAAVSDALLWSQAVARTADRDPSSRAYFDRMIGELGRVAWNVSEAVDVGYRSSARDVAPADVVGSVLGPAGAATRRLFTAIERTPDPGADAVLRFWWAGTQAVAETRFWTGPVQRDTNGVVTATFAWFELQFVDTSWRSLFVARRVQDLAVRARRLTMSLNAALWAGIADDLEARLADKIRDAVRDIDIDM